MMAFWYLIPIGLAVIAAAVMVGPGAYPPGGGHAEGRRDRLVSLAIVLLGAVLIAMPLAYDMWSRQ